jgi:hypothetical protein
LSTYLGIKVVVLDSAPPFRLLEVNQEADIIHHTHIYNQEADTTHRERIQEREGFAGERKGTRFATGNAVVMT